MWSVGTRAHLVLLAGTDIYDLNCRSYHEYMNSNDVMDNGLADRQIYLPHLLILHTRL